MTDTSLSKKKKTLQHQSNLQKKKALNMAVSFSNGFPRTRGTTHTHGMAQKVTRIIVSVFSSCDSLLYNATHKVNEVMVLKYACVLGSITRQPHTN